MEVKEDINQSFERRKARVEKPVKLQDSDSEEKEENDHKNNKVTTSMILPTDDKKAIESQLNESPRKSRNKAMLKLNEEEKEYNADIADSEFNGIKDLPMHKRPVFDRPDTIFNNDNHCNNMYLVHKMKKDAMSEYDEFAERDFGFEENKNNEEQKEMQACIEQEIFNLKIEKIVGIDKEKFAFDEKYKEKLLNYINNNSYKNKSNTGTIIGMAVFGVLGFVIFSGTIYLSIIGGILGMGVGRLIGTRFKSKMVHRTLDQRVMFEMELVIKWATSQRKNKKDKLSNVCLRLLIETIIMETCYLMEKLHLKQVKKFFKKLSKFLVKPDNSDRIIECIPSEAKVNEFDDNTTKKELYRLFSFYIPICKILRFNDPNLNSLIHDQLYISSFAHCTSSPMMDQIINLCEANETLSSQCEIIFDKDQLRKIITDAIETNEKTDTYKKLENRVMNEIVGHINLDEIDIEEGLFREDLSNNNLLPCSTNKTKNPQSNIRRNSLTNKISEHKSLQEEDKNLKSVDMNRSSNARLSQVDVEESDNEENKSDVYEDDDDFNELQMNVDEDVSSWSQVCTTDETEGTPMVLIKAVATLRGIPGDIVFRAIYDTNIRREWDKIFYKFEVVEHDEEKLETILYYIIKAPLGISNRDFLQLRKCRYNYPRKGVTTLHYKSVEHETKPEVKGIVRAETILSGYVIEQIEDDPPVTQLIIISQNDIKGLIPKYLVNMASGKAPKQWIANLISGCHELMKNEGYSI